MISYLKIFNQVNHVNLRYLRPLSLSATDSVRSRDLDFSRGAGGSAQILDFWDVALRSPLDFRDVPLRSPLDFQGVPLRSPLDFQGVPLWSPLDFRFWIENLDCRFTIGLVYRSSGNVCDP